MPDPNQTAATKKNKTDITIPEETKKQFPDLIEMIMGSRSMDDEERQYWVDVLPIMSEDQLKNLRGILDNEKKQIEKANQAYATGMKGAAQKAVKTFDEASYLEKKRARLEAERMHETEEKGDEEKLLEELENL
ncbi:hypothetical protein KJ742_07870 [Patescibacteria group bacterium]|nr:hypothetical protein [Patescibacteria group bacterium]MBU1683828.1 hypothetical protein [Patescibacteria group bacterium]MBU1935089.1 hypothetical protein [Patescibacteria group bacterium]